MSSRGSHTSGGHDNGTSVEEAIIAQLKELKLVERRHLETDSDDWMELENVYEEIVNNYIARDNDAARKSKLMNLVDDSLILRKLILRLRGGWFPEEFRPDIYFGSAMESLMKVTEQTYDVDFRKAAIVLGVVEAGAELLVLEVRTWGPQASMEPQYMNGQKRNERREVRKQIASVLTNLTFGSASMKRLVAEYNGFMNVVIDIIDNAPNLVPPYANLLRNVSWPSCKGMKSLFEATPALTRAAIHAHHTNEDKSVKSTLSAIWNIVGSGGENCVRTVVEMEGCIDMLIELLTENATKTLVVEYSTGILKYASAELVNGTKLDHCSAIRERLILRLLPLLRASSMTIVKNSLWAVSEIASKDPITVKNCLTASARDSLGNLQRSNDNEIRRPAKAILSRIGAGDYNGGSMSRSVHAGNGREMSASLRSDRLLPRRSPYCSPAMGGGAGVPNGIGLSMDAPSSSSSSHRATSLPRHFNEGVRTGGTGGGMSSSMYGGGTSGGGQYAMGSPSPLYGNMDTIRAAAQQQAHQHHLLMQQQQHSRHIAHLHQQGQPSPSQFAPPPFSCTSFAPPPGSSPSIPSSFPSTSFAPPSFVSMGGGGMEDVPSPVSNGLGQVFGANGPPTLQFEEREDGDRNDDDDDFFDDDEGDDLSTQITRAGSEQCLDEDGLSQNLSGFHSNVETANNSCRLSPVSYSDLPDSPTQCAAIRDQELQLNLPSFPIPSTLGGTVPFPWTGPSSEGGTNGSSGGLSSSQTHSSHSSHTTPNATSAEQTPTFSSLNAHYTMDYDATPRLDQLRIAASADAANSSPSTSNGIAPVVDARRENGDDEDDDYGVYGGEDILDRSIQEALPQRIEEKRDRLNSFLLDSVSSSHSSNRSPSSKGSSRYSNTSTIREDDILAAAIESAMPKMGSLSSPRGTLQHQSKNGMARWSEKTSTEMTTEGQKMSNDDEEKKKTKEGEEEDSDESDLEEYGSIMGGSLVGTMPRDVEEEMEAERIAIDCSSMKRKPHPPPRSSLLPRQLATPTTSRTTSRQATPPSGSGMMNGRPSSRPSSIGRPRPLTSTPNTSKSRLSKFPSTPRVSAVTLSGTPNGNSHHIETPSPLKQTPPTSSSASVQTTSSSNSRLKKPTASAVVPPYNYQSPKSIPREDKKGNSPKGEKEVDKTNGKMLVTTV